MLSQVNLWAERVGMLLDLILMLRILLLKVSKTYVFITLFAVLNVLYDVVAIRLGLESNETGQVLVLSRFIFAIVFPLAAWELFEEAKTVVEKIRRIAMMRMMSSLLFITIWGVIISAFTGGDESTHFQYLGQVAFIIWTGSVAATLAFLWVMKRGIKAGQIGMPHNTSVWYRFFVLMLVLQAAQCVFVLAMESIASGGTKMVKEISQMVDPVFNAFGAVLTCWCVLKLRAVPAGEANIQIVD